MKTTKHPADQPVTFTLELTEHEMLVVGDALYRLAGGARTFESLASEVRAAVHALPHTESELIAIRQGGDPIPRGILNWLRKERA